MNVWLCLQTHILFFHQHTETSLTEKTAAFPTFHRVNHCLGNRWVSSTFTPNSVHHAFLHCRSWRDKNISWLLWRCTWARSRFSPEWNGEREICFAGAEVAGRSCSRAYVGTGFLISRFLAQVVCFWTNRGGSGVLLPDSQVRECDPGTNSKPSGLLIP